MVLLGLGMGLTSAPATESIMGAVQTDKAGIGSAVNDATREVGGTLGVAVIGSVFASLYATQVEGLRGTCPPRPPRQPASRSGPPSPSPRSCRPARHSWCAPPPSRASSTGWPPAAWSPPASPWPARSRSPRTARPPRPQDPSALPDRREGGAPALAVDRA
jgi:hypothetical protein